MKAAAAIVPTSALVFTRVLEDDRVGTGSIWKRLSVCLFA